MGKDYLKKYKKEQFQNVYFVAGTATGGKTTVSKALAEKYGWLRYDADERFDGRFSRSENRTVKDVVNYENGIDSP